jgi:hypothetical protein
MAAATMVTSPAPMGTVCGKIATIAYDHFGDFEGFELETEFSHRRFFASRERRIEEAARRACGSGSSSSFSRCTSAAKSVRCACTRRCGMRDRLFWPFFLGAPEQMDVVRD